MAAQPGSYYLPNPSPWPIITSAGLFSLALGTALAINGIGAGRWLMLFGAVVIASMLICWFGQVIRESEGGVYGARVDRSFRWGMAWFIFSEVMFFVALFGALFYARVFAVHWLGANDLLWPGYDATWPTAGPAGPIPVAPGALPDPSQFTPIEVWGIPAVNTFILLTSSFTVTWAYWGLRKNNRARLITGLFFTVCLGLTFLGLQAYDYVHAYTELGLTLRTGIYGATFFMLTGFHGLHVTIGTIMLSVILARSLLGHFHAERYFGFEAVAWYWYFLNVVWLLLFIFVYWL